MAGPAAAWLLVRSLGGGGARVARSLARSGGGGWLGRRARGAPLLALAAELLRSIL